MTQSVAKRSDASAAMESAAARGRALMGGTRAMRAASTAYLPRFTAESEEAYKERLGLSWLFNGYRKTVKDMAGRVFDKPVEIVTAPREIEEWAGNIDLAGRDLSTFADQVFKDALSGAGISFIMVDAPPRAETTTRAQARDMNLRPYLISLRVEDILGWRTETVNNVTVLSQIRIFETVTEPDPEDEFSDITIEQVRVLDRTESGVQVRIYRKQAKRDAWELHQEPTFTGLDEITVTPFYANRTGFFTGEPLLDDLADVNIAHWQSQSDQRNILHVARVPILFARGLAEEDDIIISTSKAVKSSGDNADLKWVEHTGAAIGAGRQDLKDLEFQMEMHGLQLLLARGGAQSATGEVLDAKKETSTLSMTADQLQDSLERALGWMAAYDGQPDAEITVAVNKEFGAGTMTAQEAQVMLTAVNTGQLSRATFLSELARRGLIRSDIDPDEEAQRIEDETGDLFGGEDGDE